MRFNQIEITYTITADNYFEAEAAIRDILFMYRDLIRSYDGFGHNIDVGTFDPFTFVNADLYESPDSTLAMDMDLVHQGSAVALLCHLSDFWDEGHGLNQWNWGKKLRGVLKQGRLNHLPLAKEAIMAGFESEETFRSLLPGVYTQYVLGYFQRLLQERY